MKKHYCLTLLVYMVFLSLCQALMSTATVADTPAQTSVLGTNVPLEPTALEPISSLPPVTILARTSRTAPSSSSTSATSAPATGQSPVDPRLVGAQPGRAIALPAGKTLNGKGFFSIENAKLDYLSVFDDLERGFSYIVALEDMKNVVRLNVGNLQKDLLHSDLNGKNCKAMDVGIDGFAIKISSDFLLKNFNAMRDYSTENLEHEDFSIIKGYGRANASEIAVAAYNNMYTFTPTNPAIMKFVPEGSGGFFYAMIGHAPKDFSDARKSSITSIFKAISASNDGTVWYIGQDNKLKRADTQSVDFKNIDYTTKAIPAINETIPDGIVDIKAVVARGTSTNFYMIILAAGQDGVFYPFIRNRNGDWHKIQISNIHQVAIGICGTVVLGDFPNKDVFVAVQSEWSNATKNPIVLRGGEFPPVTIVTKLRPVPSLGPVAPTIPVPPITPSLEKPNKPTSTPPQPAVSEPVSQPLLDTDLRNFGIAVSAMAGAVAVGTAAMGATAGVIAYKNKKKRDEAAAAESFIRLNPNHTALDQFYVDFAQLNPEVRLSQATLTREGFEGINDKLKAELQNQEGYFVAYKRLLKQALKIYPHVDTSELCQQRAKTLLNNLIKALIEAPQKFGPKDLIPVAAALAYVLYQAREGDDWKKHPRKMWQMTSENILQFTAIFEFFLNVDNFTIKNYQTRNADEENLKIVGLSTLNSSHRAPQQNWFQKRFLNNDRFEMPDAWSFDLNAFVPIRPAGDYESLPEQEQFALGLAGPLPELPVNDDTGLPFLRVARTQSGTLRPRRPVARRVRPTGADLGTVWDVADARPMIPPPGDVVEIAGVGSRASGGAGRGAGAGAGYDAGGAPRPLSPHRGPLYHGDDDYVDRDAEPLSLAGPPLVRTRRRARATLPSQAPPPSPTTVSSVRMRRAAGVIPVPDGREGNIDVLSGVADAPRRARRPLVRQSVQRTSVAVFPRAVTPQDGQASDEVMPMTPRRGRGLVVEEDV